MNTTPTVNDLKNMSSATSFYLSPHSLIRWGLVIFGVMLTIGIILSLMLTSTRENIMFEDVKNRIEIVAQDKAELAQAWVSKLQESGKHITESDVMRLFAIDSQGATKKESLKKALAEQRKYFQISMNEYVRQNDLASAHIVNRDGIIVIASQSAAALNAEQLKYVQNVVDSGKDFISPFSVVDGEVVTVVAKPIFDMSGKEDGSSVSAVLVSTFVVTNKVLHFLKDSSLTKAGEKTYLLQDNAGVMQYLALNNDKATLYSIVNNNVDDTLVGERALVDFTYSKSMLDDDEVFAATSYVFDTPFIFLQEIEKSTAFADVNRYAYTVNAIMLLIVISVSGLGLLLVNFIIGIRNKYRVNHQQQVLDALVKAVEIRDPYLGGHHERVARTALEVANKMRLSIPERSTLYYAAMLSGIGKIFVSRKILTKETALTEVERKKLQEHISFAMEVLGDMDFDLPVAEVIEQMYERIDGTGYPHSKEGADINFLSRILGACDVYCALTKPRAYRDAMPVDKALKVMDEEKDKYDKGVMGVIKALKA